MKKKIIALLTVLILIFSASTIPIYAQSDDLWYRYINNNDTYNIEH